MSSTVNGDSTGSIQREVAFRGRHTRRQEEEAVLINSGQATDITARADNFCRLGSVVAENLPSREAGSSEVDGIDVPRRAIRSCFTDKEVTVAAHIRVGISATGIDVITIIIPGLNSSRLGGNFGEYVADICKILSVRHLPVVVCTVLHKARKERSVADRRLHIYATCERQRIIGISRGARIDITSWGGCSSRIGCGLNLNNIPSVVCCDGSIQGRLVLH